MQQEINWELFRQVAERAKQEPHMIHMNAWVSIFDEESGEYDVSDGSGAEYASEVAYGVMFDCNTAGCIVGTGIILEPERAQPLFEEGKDMEEIGRALFGVSESIAKRLFYSSAWPKHYRVMSDAYAVVEIIERALSEQSFDFLLEK